MNDFVSTATAPHLGEESVLDFDQVTCAFGGNQVLTSVTFSVSKGRVRGLIGPNGAGKTTLLNVATGHARANSGAVLHRGMQISGKRPDQVAHIGVARTFQAAKPINRMTVVEDVMAGAYRRGKAGMAGSVFASKRAREEERQARETAIELLHMVKLEGLAGRDVSTCTAGQLRLISVARALATRPSVVLLDEPAAGLTAAESEHLDRALREIADSGVDMLVIEHDVNFITRLCDDVVVLDFGRVIADQPASELRSNPAVVEAFLGPDSEAIDGELA